MNFINSEYCPAYPICKLLPHPENYREGDTGAIIEAIGTIGFYGAIIAQKATHFVLAGNHRLQAVAHSGAETIPVIFVDCDNETARRILISDNRTSDLATNNFALLADLLADVQQVQGSLEGTGYDEQDLARMCEDVQRQTLDLDSNVKTEVKTAKEKNSQKENDLSYFPVLVRCYTHTDREELLNALREQGYLCESTTAR